MTAPKSIPISDYNYNLPQERIAKFPLEERDKCKLLVFNDGKISETIFFDIKDMLSEDGLLVVNNTKVIPARTEFFTESGARVEVFCLEPNPPFGYDTIFSARKSCVWKCIVGNLKRWKAAELNRKIAINNDEIVLTVKKLSVGGSEVLVEFSWTGEYSFSEVLDAVGSIPIPPYLNRKAQESDNYDYQTVFSLYKGSVAAPTAGLHFSSQLMEQIKCKVSQLTLHVGAGTFKPVKTETIGEHEMHSEVFSVNQSLITDLIAHLGKITAVGTTSVRTLESLYWVGVKILHQLPFSHISQWECYDDNWTEVSPESALNAVFNYMKQNNTEVITVSTGIMICPGYKYKITDNIITNFHQPESTLLLLVSAAVGDDWKKIYDYALNHDFRFLSYGDGCFLKVKKI